MSERRGADHAWAKVWRSFDSGLRQYFTAEGSRRKRRILDVNLGY